jgi:hypothetical protein
MRKKKRWESRQKNQKCLWEVTKTTWFVLFGEGFASSAGGGGTCWGSTHTHTRTHTQTHTHRKTLRSGIFQSKWNVQNIYKKSSKNCFLKESIPIFFLLSYK